MSNEAVAVLRDALALSEVDRADIAAELLASLGQPESGLDIDSEDWLREIERRARAVLDEKTNLESWDAVEQGIRDKLASR